MSTEEYLAAISFAAPWLDHARPRPERAGAGHHCPNGKAVYVVCDYSGKVVYVGSTSRKSFGVGARVKEHMRNEVKTVGWSEVWSIPLRDDTPLRSIRMIEGLVGRYLGVGASRLPRIPTG